MGCLLVFVFYWNDDGGGERWVVVEGRFFISRFVDELRRYLGYYDRIGVYIYWVDSDHCGRVVDTGYQSSFISRRHLLVDTRVDGVYIMDHGRDGGGSTNGTYLNDVKLDPGRWYRVRPGDIIRLGGDPSSDYSPGLAIVVGLLGEDGRPVLSIGSGRQHLPESIAVAGADKGVEILKKASEDMQDKPIVLANVPDKPIHVETSYARVYYDNSMVVLYQSLLDLHGILAYVYKAKRISDQYIVEIRGIVENDEFIEAINRWCSRGVHKVFNELRQAISHGSMDLVVEYLDTLLTLLRRDLGLKNIAVKA